MLGKAPTPLRLASIALAFGVVFAMPVASAFGMGVDADSVPEMRSAGAAPAYGQTWVGQWIKKSGWGGFEADMRAMRDAGVTPVVMWYYYGDSISPSCVSSGCDGRTKGDWDAMAKELATRAKAIMGSAKFYVVLEPEFQKNGIQDWETFDGYLENQAKIIRAAAPSVSIVVGFGHWGNWDRFDRAVAASDMVGFQVLRGSTRDSSATAIGSADYMIDLAKKLKARWGKSVMVFDLGIATYGGWEGVQEQAIRAVIAKRGELDAAGVKVIVWRYVSDNNHSSGYFGAAESTWGVKTASGAKKPAYDDLVALIKGASAPPASGGTTPAPSGGAPSGSVFSEVKGNNYWIQTKVAGSPKAVDARVNGGAWVKLAWQSWGAWAVSTHAPTGSKVELRATFADGSTKSALYDWPSATPATGGGTSAPTTPPASGGAPSGSVFSEVKGNNYWVQTKVAGSPKTVETRVNGGAWVKLAWQSWGAWAVSTPAPTGSKVELRATFGDGSSKSAIYEWPSAKLVSGSGAAPAPAPSGGAFDATFSGVKVQEWWVQSSVSGNQAIAKVEARVNGGAWQLLNKESYGYAKSIHVLAGQKVEFRATSTSGATDMSGAYSR